MSILMLIHDNDENHAKKLFSDNMVNQVSENTFKLIHGLLKL